MKIRKSRRIKVYLDTNMVLDIFINHAKALKQGEEVLLPKKYEFMLANKGKIKFMTSFITKAEVMRELISAYGASYDDVLLVWDKFIQSLESKYIRSFRFGESLPEIAGKPKMRLRTMFNFLHIIIAASEGAYFISGDKPAIEKSKELGFYDKTISYEGFRKMLDGDA